MGAGGRGAGSRGGGQDPANGLSRLQGEVSEGCRLPVLRRNQENEDEWRE